MTEQMRAAVVHKGNDRFVIEDIDIPELGDTDVLVKVEAAGINTGMLFNWRFLNRTVIMPTVLGLHGCGTVERVGSRVTEWSGGERVHVDPVMACGRCFACANDRRVLCENNAIIGFATTPNGRGKFEQYHLGAMAQYWKVPERNLHRLPEALSYDAGAWFGTLGTSYHGIRMTEPRFGATMVLTGATGGNGVAAVKCAPLFGIEKVIAVGRSQGVLDELAKLEPGLVTTLNLSNLPEDWQTTGGLTDAIRELAGPRGAEILVDFLPGTHAATAQSLYALNHGSTASFFGGSREPLILDYVRTMPVGQYRLQGLKGHGEIDVLQLHDYLDAGRLEVDDLVTHTFPLEQANDAIDLLDSRAGTKTWWISINPNE